MTTTLTWINPNDTFLSQSQALNNAQIVANHFSGTDWTKESLSALCGNMWHESSLNPDMHELGYNDSPDRGYGLVQWTPMTKYTDWATSEGLPWDSGDSQLARIDYEVNNNIQWIVKSTYGNTSFSDFRKNAGGWSVDYLTDMFMNCYERPAAATANLSDRQSFASQCFTSLDWTGTGGGGGTPTPYYIQNKAAQYQYETEGALGMYIQVKSGDNLSSIAKSHGVNVNDIKRVTISDIPNKNIISIGEVLLLPTTSTPTQPAPQPEQTIKRYVVAAGDNLTKISLHLGVPISTLVSKNGIKDQNKIYIGQILKY